MTDERQPDLDPTFDPDPVFGEAEPTVHPGHPALRRALDHAPDRGHEPTDELRQAIRSFAHESVAPSLPSGRAGLRSRRAGEGPTGLEARTRSRRSRLLRNLVVAALLVVIVAAVTWHREPGPSGSRPATPAPEAAAPSAAPTASAANAPTPPAETAASAAVAAASAPPVLSEAEKILFAPRVTLPPSEPPALPATTTTTPSTTAKAVTPATPSTPLASTPSSASPTPTPTQPATAPMASSRTPVPALPSAAVPVPEASAGATAGRAPMPSPTTTPPGGRVTASLGAAGGSPVAKPAPEALPPGPPTFTALSQWNQLTMTRADGSTRRRSKADARELGALLGSAALAGGGAEPVRGRVDWRVSLERNGQTLARVELAGNQVRWIENGAAPGVGTPPPGSLDSVREMLENVFDEPASGAATSAVPAAGNRTAPVPVEVPAQGRGSTAGR